MKNIIKIKKQINIENNDNNKKIKPDTLFNSYIFKLNNYISQQNYDKIFSLIKLIDL